MLKTIFFRLSLPSMLAFLLTVPSSAETLSLSVSHSEYLTSVSDLQSRVAVPEHYQQPSLQAGADQSDSSLKSESMFPSPIKPSLEGSARKAPEASSSSPVPLATAPTVQRPVIEWFPIPAIMAGVWSKRGDLTTSVTDLRTGISEPLNQWIDDEMTVTWGHQTDKKGNVWHANLLPAERDSQSNGKTVKFLTVGQKLEGTSPSSLVTRTHYLVSERYGSNGPVADVFQQEALNHYQISGQSELQNNSTNRIFAYRGDALRDGALVTRFQRVGPFAPIFSLSGIDLVQSLDNYLKSIGRPDLMH